MATYNLNFGSSFEQELPFLLKLQFDDLFQHWEEMAQSDLPGQAKFAQEVLEKLDTVPLRGYIEDYKQYSQKL